MMDPKTGMYPDNWTCRHCNKRLNADGGHPAELYAGTYAGLCYACQNRPFEVIATDSLDGATTVEYPPSCPSYRRNREQFTAYTDCEHCKGRGATPKTNGQGYCRPCLDRYCNHPVRLRQQARRTRIHHAASHVWALALWKAGVTKKTTKKQLERHTHGTFNDGYDDKHELFRMIGAVCRGRCRFLYAQYKENALTNVA